MSLILFFGCVGLTALPQKDGSTTDTGATTSVGGLRLDRTSLDFGSVPVGASSDEVLTLSTDGGPVQVELGLDGYGYEVSSGSLTVDGEELVTLTLSPTDVGPYNGTLTVLVDAADSLSLPLTGEGTEEGDADTDTDADTDADADADVGNISVTPTSYDFGNVDIGDDAIKTFTVSNTGDDDLIIDDVTTSAGVWTWDGTLAPPVTLAPGGNRLLEVTFAPTTATSYAGSVTVHSNDPDSPDLAISLAGEGVDLCDICSPLIDVQTGGDPYSIDDFLSGLGFADERTVTIENIGDEDLVVSNVSVTNEPLFTCGTFTVGGWGSAETLRPRATTTFTISYLATDTCVEAANLSLDWNILHILSNDPSQGDWTIELGGAGF